MTAAAPSRYHSSFPRICSTVLYANAVNAVEKLATAILAVCRLYKSSPLSSAVDRDRSNV